LNQIFPLFLWANKEVGLSEDHRAEILNYLGTCIYHYVRQHLKTVSESKLVYFHYDISIERRIENKDLISKYRELVNEGNCVPLTPLQYQVFLGLNNNLDPWISYGFYSALLNPVLSNKFDSLLPSLDGTSRDMFKMYARNHDKLKSIHYMPNVAMSFQKHQVFGITFETFVKEMFVRTVTGESMPDFLYPVSTGDWKISGSSLSPVNPASINRTFCKFEMIDSSSDIEEFINSMLLKNHDMRYIKGTVRLSERLPLVYSIYVQSSSSVVDEIESE
jgi:hypothetical protein